MRYAMFVVGFGCWMALAFADYQTTPTKPFDLGDLVSEIKAVVPTLEGCDDTWGTITCRRLTEDFTDAERAAIEIAITAHDAVASRQRREEKPLEIPLEDFGAGAAGALAVLGGRGLVIMVRKKKSNG